MQVYFSQTGLFPREDAELLSNFSFIIPVQADGGSSRFVLERLDQVLPMLNGYGSEVVVADASENSANIVQRKTIENGGLYVSAPRQIPFAPGLARDAGAMHATRQFLFFFDVDLWLDNDSLLNLETSLDPRFGFSMVPCLYLTAEATRNLDEGRVSVRSLWEDYLRGNFTDVTNLAVASSAILIDRQRFLSLGGHRPEFSGHGCEDLELIFRLVHEAPIGVFDDDQYVDARQECIAESRGFRRYYAYYGLPVAMRGFMLAHRWHPRPPINKFFRNRNSNDQLFQKFMRAHVLHGDAPAALPDLTVSKVTAVVLAPGLPDIQAFRHFLPALGRYRLVTSCAELPIELYTQVLYIGMTDSDAATWQGFLPTSVSSVGSLTREMHTDGAWRLVFRDRLTGNVVRDELHFGSRRFPRDGQNPRWVFYRGTDMTTQAVIYDMSPPDFADLDAFPPLDNYIRNLLKDSGYDPQAFPGLFMNQWGQISRTALATRRIRKLLRNPSSYWRDSVIRRWLVKFGKGAP